MRLKRQRNAASAPIELPPRGASVVLSTSVGGRIPARVIEREQDSLTVAITVPVAELTPGQLERMVLEYAGPRGRLRLHGAFTMADPGDHELLRIDAPRSIEVLQEREHVRIKAARPVLVYAGRDQVQVQSYTVDLSGGGLLLAGPDTLKVGDQVRFKLTITADSAPIIGSGVVVRVDASGHRALALEEISDLDRRRLVRFIFECQRQELRRGLQRGGADGR